jgi:putative oxidoreductase
MIRMVLGGLGRMALSLIFILSSLAKTVNWPGTKIQLTDALTQWLGYSIGQESIQRLLNLCLSFVPQILATFTGFEMLGGILLFLGFKVRFGATLLILFLIPATILFHPFWVMHGAERDLQMVMFLKNLAIFGGLVLALAYHGSNKAKSG